jgi:hypothetical protein
VSTWDARGAMVEQGWGGEERFARFPKHSAADGDEGERGASSPSGACLI